MEKAYMLPRLWGFVAMILVHFVASPVSAFLLALFQLDAPISASATIGLAAGAASGLLVGGIWFYSIRTMKRLSLQPSDARVPGGLAVFVNLAYMLPLGPVVAALLARFLLQEEWPQVFWYGLAVLGLSALIHAVYWCAAHLFLMRRVRALQGTQVEWEIRRGDGESANPADKTENS